MSGLVDNGVSLPAGQHEEKMQTKPIGGFKDNYKGFVGGVFSGIAKLSGMAARYEIFGRNGS